MMLLQTECSTCPYAIANPLKLTASAYFSLLSLVTHKNTGSQRNMQAHMYNVSRRFLLTPHHRPLHFQVIANNVLNAALMRINEMCGKRRNAKKVAY